MSPTRRRQTELTDLEHANLLIEDEMLEQGKYWVSHDNERAQVFSMNPTHALSAYRKLVEYAREGLVELSIADMVASPLGAALRTQAMGDDATQAEITHLKALARNGQAPKTVVVTGNRLRTSVVLAAVEDLEEEIAGDDDNSKYTGPVDYAVRLTELINERLAR